MKDRLFKNITRLLAGSVLLAGTWVQAQEWGAPAEEPAPQPAQPAPQPAPQPAEQPALGMQPADPGAASPQVELQQLQMQLQQISGQLSQIRQQAFEVQEIMDAITAYEQQLRAKMVALSPDVEDDIQQAEDLVDELRAVEDPGALSPADAEEFQEKYMEFQQMVQRLQPIEQEASMDPEMQAAQQELESKVMAAMEDIDPQSAELMQERDQLIQRYMQLEQQLQQQQQQQQQQLQPQQPAQPGQEEPTLDLQEF